MLRFRTLLKLGSRFKMTMHFGFSKDNDNGGPGEFDKSGESHAKELKEYSGEIKITTSEELKGILNMSQSCKSRFMIISPRL